MKARAFNKITIDHKNNFITKTSSNSVKLQDEVNYYLKLPEKIAQFFPKLIKYSHDFTEYTLEYVPYRDLSDLVLTNKITLEEGKNVINRLVKMLEDIHYFKPRTAGHTVANENFYIKKTSERVENLKSVSIFENIIGKSSLYINDKSYKSFHSLQGDFIKRIQNFFAVDSTTTAIHGDFCFSNILYCPETKDIKLIDPRGSFGNSGIYGHPDYDYAKLMHCLHGRYDMIVNNNYELEQHDANHFSFKRPVSGLLKKLHKHYQTLLKDRGVNVEFSYLIEASLFISMAALHYECQKRQKALFLTGIIIMNNFFRGKYENLH